MTVPDIQKPRLESPSSGSSAKQASPPRRHEPFPESQTPDSLLASMMDADSLNGEWPSLLTDECNPYMLGDTGFVSGGKLEQQDESSIPYESFRYMYNQGHAIQEAAVDATQFPIGSPFADPTPMSTDSPWRISKEVSTELQHISPRELASTCDCNQQVLHQLHNLTSLLEIPAAFDTALNRNKEAVNLCHRILTNQNHHHPDISFVMTLTALIAKIIVVYDQVYDLFNQHVGSSSLPLRNANHLHEQETFNERLMAPSPGMMSACRSDSPHSCSTSMSGITPPSLSNFPVRLTLGTYQLDQEDEEKLKSDIFRIELSKVGSLIRAFEQKFCDAAPQTHQQSKYEAKAFEDMLYYLQKRLRVSVERPRRPGTMHG